jgi:small subunit ribosomal protein S6
LASYELMFIVKPELDEEQVVTATDRVHQLVVANGGNVTKTASWGKRRLAYRVGLYREGYYVVSNFDVDAAKIAELERVLKISDTVFRHLLVKRDTPAIGQQEVVVPEATPEEIAAMYEPAVSEDEAEAAPAAVAAGDEDAEVETQAEANAAAEGNGEDAVPTEEAAPDVPPGEAEPADATATRPEAAAPATAVTEEAGDEPE